MHGAKRKWHRVVLSLGSLLCFGIQALASPQADVRSVPSKEGAAVLRTQKLARQGKAAAQYELGLRYYYGEGTPQDFEQAQAWFRKAAEQGNPQAQYSLGVMYSKGQGLAQSPQEAAAWFLKAANQGHAKAQFNLGLMYDKGEGFARDFKQAAAWFEKAALQGHLKAQHNLAAMYAAGQGVYKDEALAYVWFECATRQGFEPSRRAGNALLKSLGKEALKKAQKLLNNEACFSASGNSP